MKIVYCANCGKRLNIKRKAMKGYGTIIDLVEFHECGEVEEPDLTPVNIPTFGEVEGKNEFVKKLDGLSPSSVSTGELRDRRFEKESPQVTSAPTGVKALMDSMLKPTPEGSGPESED